MNYTDHLGNHFPSIESMLKHYGISKTTWKRRKQSGMALREILTAPLSKDHTKKPCKDHLGNDFPSVTAMLEHYGIPATTWKKRREKGMTLEEILTTPRDNGPSRKPCKDHLGNDFPSITAMLEHYGIPETTWKNQRKRGLSLEKILTKSDNRTGRRKKRGATDHTGVSYPTAVDMCKAWGIPVATYHARLASGKTVKQALTNPAPQKQYNPVKDHKGNEFPSTYAMCKHWGINITTFLNRINTGIPLEKALTTDTRIGNVQVRDYMGRTFPTRVDMGNYYGIGEKAFIRLNRKEPVFEDCIRRYYPGRDFGNVHVINVLTFPYMLISYKGEEYVWTLEQVLEEYHSNEFNPIAHNSNLKKNLQIKARTGTLQYVVVSEDGTEQVWDYWTLINYYRQTAGSNPATT